MGPYGGHVSQAKALWDVGQEPGRQLVALGMAVALTAVTIDVFIVGRVSLFFDLAFVTLCLGLAALVRLDDFFIVALMPPIMMLAVFTLVALVAPEALGEAGDGFTQTLVSGMVRHSWALLAGFVLCLGWMGFRARQADA